MSALKSILVQMDTSPRSAVRLQLAHQLAQQHDATITALYPAGPTHRPPDRTPSFGGDLVPAMQAIRSQHVALAKAIFDGTVVEGMPRASFAAVDGDPVRAFARQALVSDLMVLGQREPSDDHHSDLPDDFAESVLLDSGRPALVVPHIGMLSTFAQVALVAWKESAESARAVSAALPLLQRADKVHIATWDDGSAEAPDQGRIDIEAYLRAHGVDATLRSYGPATRELGEHLLSLTSDLGVGLMVMGCYGTSRAREWALGGATRSVLQAMTVPVLMTH